MVDGRSQNIPLLGMKLVGSYTIAESIKQSRENPMVGAVVLRDRIGRRLGHGRGRDLARGRAHQPGQAGDREHGQRGSERRLTTSRRPPRACSPIR